MRKKLERKVGLKEPKFNLRAIQIGVGDTSPFGDSKKTPEQERIYAEEQVYISR